MSAGFASSSLPGLGDQVAQQIIASARSPLLGADTYSVPGLGTLAPRGFVSCFVTDFLTCDIPSDDAKIGHPMPKGAEPNP